jgi:DNA-nicking Smr family endonuclease
MTADRQRRRRGELSDEDSALWTSVTRSIRRLRRRKPPPQPNSAPEPPPAAAPRTPKLTAAVKPTPVPKVPAAPPPLAALEPRLKQRLARGTQAIDSRLDLHGLTQAEAHDALRAFLRASQAKGATVVLVITGKGRLGQEHGILRRAVPQWLRLPEFRQTIVGFEQAAIGHGGEGALYVRLRKLRS